MSVCVADSLLSYVIMFHPNEQKESTWFFLIPETPSCCKIETRRLIPQLIRQINICDSVII